VITNKSQGRKFTLLDAMVLIAATAFSLLPVGWSIEHLVSRMGRVSWGRLHEESYREFLIQETTLPRQIASGFSEVAIYFLMFYTLVILGMRLLPPRPSVRELSRQPGLWACTGATLGLALIVWVPYFKPVIIPAAVGLAWLTLAASGRWCSESSWLDRTGRALGVCWLAMLPPFIWFAWTG
jgi:hypothetical protein